MSMLAFGPMELLLLLALSGAGRAPDLVSLLPADKYFQVRKIEVTVDKMLELATRDPKDGKTQFAQLMALRTLAEQTDQIKKARREAEVAKTLREIIEGKKAKDAHGFAADHARVALARLTGDPLKPGPAKPGTLAGDALSWFPTPATLVGGLEGRPGTNAALATPVPGFWTKFLKEEQWQKVFEIAETIGNVRLDRVSFALNMVGERDEEHCVFARISGKFHHQRLIKALKDVTEENGANDMMQVVEKKGPQGEPITIIHMKLQPPAFAFIGDTDMLLAGYVGQGNQLQLLNKALDVRAKKQGSLLESNEIKERLSKVSKDAIGIVVGHLPEDLRRGMRGPGGLAAAPNFVRIEVMPRAGELLVGFHGELDNADDAKSFCEAVQRLKDEGITALKNLPPQLPIPKTTVAALIKTLESVRVEAQGAAAVGSISLSTEAIQSLPSWLMQVHGEEFDAPPAAPAKAK